jgi:hypothetical protein
MAYGKSYYRIDKEAIQRQDRLEITMLLVFVAIFVVSIFITN